MTVISNLDDDIKKALKNHDKVTVLVLRSLKSALHNEVIAQKQAEASPEMELAVLKREIKKRKEAIEAYQAAARADLAQVENDELEVLEKYMPPQLDESGIKAVIDEVLGNLPDSEKNFGQVMKTVMSKLQGQADGKLVGELVKKQI